MTAWRPTAARWVSRLSSISSTVNVVVECADNKQRIRIHTTIMKGQLLAPISCSLPLLCIYGH